jgi:hypothetical protein
LAPNQIDSWARRQALCAGEASLWFSHAWVHPEEIERLVHGELTLNPSAVVHFEPKVQCTRGPGLYTPYTPPLAMERRYLRYASPFSQDNQQAVRAGDVLDTLRLITDYLKQWHWPPQLSTVFALTDLVPYSAAYAEDAAIQHGRRPRPMSLKHVEIGLFALRHGGRESRAELMAHWNRLHPDWAYESADQFSSDSTRAFRRTG